MQYIAKLRPQPATDEASSLVFLNGNGNPVCHVATDFQYLSRDPGHKMTVNATEVRKLVSMAVAALQDDAGLRLLANHMTHGVDTARRYYQHLGVSCTV